MAKGAPPNHAWSRLACDEACVRIALVALGRSRPGPHGAWPRGRAGDAPPQPRSDAGDADRHGNSASGQEYRRFRVAGPAHPKRRDRPGVAGSDRRADPSPRGLSQAPRRAHAQIGPACAHDGRRRQGPREREAAARPPRRQPARRPRHAAGGQRRQHPHQCGAASIVRATNLRSLVQRPQSSALGRGQRRTAGRRRGGPQSHRQLDRRRRRATVARQDRHGRDHDRACAGRRPAWLDCPPICLPGSGREDAKPIAPCARRRFDICALRRAAARWPRRAGQRAQFLRSIRSQHARGHRRRVRGGPRADRRQCAWPRHARAEACCVEARSDRAIGRQEFSIVSR